MPKNPLKKEKKDSHLFTKKTPFLKKKPHQKAPGVGKGKNLPPSSTRKNPFLEGGKGFPSKEGGRTGQRGETAPFS